jgi:hypothetical protein
VPHPRSALCLRVRITHSVEKKKSGKLFEQCTEPFVVSLGILATIPMRAQLVISTDSKTHQHVCCQRNPKSVYSLMLNSKIEFVWQQRVAAHSDDVYTTAAQMLHCYTATYTVLYTTPAVCVVQQLLPHHLLYYYYCSLSTAL